MTAKLYGVGVGPGDSNLLTIKALEVLEEVDYICAPQSGNKKDSLALKIVKEKVDIEDRVIKLNFPMSYNQNELDQAHSVAALKIKKKLAQGKNLAFITLGDPLFYSTYIYILNKLNINQDASNVQIETVPGITSVSACSARSNLPLAENDENVAIISKVKSRDHLKNILQMFETVVVLKLTRNFKKAYEVLNELNLEENTIVTSRCGQKEEMIIKDINKLEKDNIDYLSLLITKTK